MPFVVSYSEIMEAVVKIIIARQLFHTSRLKEQKNSHCKFKGKKMYNS